MTLFFRAPWGPPGDPPNLTLFDFLRFWPFLVIFGVFWPFLGVFRVFGAFRDFGVFWSFLAVFGVFSDFVVYPYKCLIP